MEDNMRVAKEKIDLLLDLFEVDLLNLDSLLANANKTEEENNLTTTNFVIDEFDFRQARTLIEQVETSLDIL